MRRESIVELKKVAIKVLLIILASHVVLIYPSMVSAHVAIVSSPTSCDSADLTIHTSNQIDSRLSLSSPSNALPMYSTRVDASSTPWVRNTNSWTQKGTPIDFTGVAGWNSYGGYTHGATLISPRNFIAANHFGMPNGTTVEFFDASGTPVVRTVTGSYTIPNTDINIGVLDSDVPDSITYYPLIASSTLNFSVQKIINQALDVPIVVFDQEGKAIVHKMTYQGQGGINHRAYTSGLRSGFSEDIVGGDSGQPGFIIIDGKPVLLFAHYGAEWSETNGVYISQINQIMSDLNSGGYQATSYNPDCFTSYVPNHAPVFSSSYKRLYLDQNKISTTTPFSSVSASDADVGQNVSYSIASLSGQLSAPSMDPDEYFRIDSLTGELYKKKNIDTSVYGNYINLIVKATDDATYYASSTATVAITFFNLISQNYEVDQVASSTISATINKTIPSLGIATYDDLDRLLLAPAQGFMEEKPGETNFFRLLPNGTRDTSFSDPFIPASSIYSVFNKNGSIFVSGQLGFVSGSSSNTVLAKLNQEGVPDSDFINDFSFSGTVGGGGYAIPFNDQIVVIGQTLNPKKIARYNLDGTFDTTFDTNIGTGLGTTTGNPLNRPFPSFYPLSYKAGQWGDKFLVGGLGSSFNGVSEGKLFRLNSDGTLDNDFLTVSGAGLNNGVGAITQYTNGRVLIGGFFSTYNGSSAPGLLMLNQDGSVDTSFENNLGSGFTYASTQFSTGQVFDIVVQTDGKILVGGQFDTFNGVFTGAVVRLNPNGTLDTTFQNNIGSGIDGSVRTMSLRSDGALAISGSNGMGFDTEPFSDLLNAIILLTKTPPAPVLNYSSDTDPITTDSLVTFSGLAAPGGVVNILDNSNPLLTTTADANGNYEATTTLLSGTHLISAFQVLTLTNTATSSPSDAISINVNAVKISGGGGGSSSGGGGGGASSVNLLPSLSTSTPQLILSQDKEVLKAQLIQKLTNLIAELKALAQKKGVTINIPNISGINISSSNQFTKSLSLNMIDPDVKLLQIYLNTHGFLVATSGTGSPGNENRRFGPKTKSALIEFQKAHNILPATGRFGEQTRKFINGL